VRELLVTQAAQWDEHRLCWWWWRDRRSDELVGMCGLNRAELEGESSIEIGWSLPAANQGQGFATEMASASLAWGLGPRGLDRIIGFTMPENARSEAVMRRLEMTFVRTFTRKGFLQVLYEARAGN
jgi:[ribosomal protein S5]-alanine N-acetyltransferase